MINIWQKKGVFLDDWRFGITMVYLILNLGEETKKEEVM